LNFVHTKENSRERIKRFSEDGYEGGPIHIRAKSPTFAGSKVTSSDEEPTAKGTYSVETPDYTTVFGVTTDCTYDTKSWVPN